VILIKTPLGVTVSLTHGDPGDEVTVGVNVGVGVNVFVGVRVLVGVMVLVGVNVGVNVLVGVMVLVGVLVGVKVGVGVGVIHVPGPIGLIVTPDSTKLFVNPDVAGNKQTHSKFMVSPAVRLTPIKTSPLHFIQSNRKLLGVSFINT